MPHSFLYISVELWKSLLAFQGAGALINIWKLNEAFKVLKIASSTCLWLLSWTWVWRVKSRAIFRALRPHFKIDGESFKTCDQVRGRVSHSSFFVVMLLPRDTPSEDLTAVSSVRWKRDRQTDRHRPQPPSLFGNVHLTHLIINHILA